MITIVLSALLGLLVLSGLVCEWTRLRKQVHRQENRIENLEHAARLRMPHEAMDKILNAMAALDALQREKKLETDFIENTQAWLKKAMTVGTSRNEN